MTTIECESEKDKFNEYENENENENDFDFNGKYDVENNAYNTNKNKNNKSDSYNNNKINDTHNLSITQEVTTPTLENTRQQLVELNEKGDEHLLSSKDICTAYIDESFQAVFDDNLQPLTERWSPLGANYDDALSANSELISPASELELLSSDSQDKHAVAELTRLRNMEDEQEMLTQSLLALTSHFAHVQLRVRQIVEAPLDERDQLLQDLEEFAFQGIPEPPDAAITSSPKRSASSLTTVSTDNTQQRQFELIDHLKSQLTELEKLAYESGAPVLPQQMLLEKQRIIIEEIKQKLNFKLDEHELPVLTSEELKNQVDNAIGEFIGPLKMKDQLVAQLKTQITDLERFIAFLQCDTSDAAKAANVSEKFNHAYNSYAAKNKNVQAVIAPEKSPNAINTDDVLSKVNANILSSGRHAAQDEHEQQQNQSVRESLNSKAHGLLDKASLLMQMFATTHFGTKQEHFQKNILKKTNKGNHWGDLRAQLEVDIQEVASLAATLNFDREKLANMKRAMKKAASTSASTSTSAPASTSQTPSLATIKENQKHSGALAKMSNVANSRVTNYAPKTYTLSSEDSDDENDIYDHYNWTQSNRRVRVKGDSINTLAKELTTAVRKNFAITLLRLIQHGLRIENESAASSLIVPFMRCLHPSPMHTNEHAHDSSFLSSTTNKYGHSYNSDHLDDDVSGSGGLFGANSGTRPMHAWELILEYYYLKHGDEYNNTPARKLSESFNLDIVDANAVTPKQSLLSTIGMIITMHRPYKRSMNAHFKAFVCAALNSHQLVEWLNLILSCNDLIDTYYTANSYVVRTGFRDSLRSIDTLTKYDFDLPVDLAIRHFRNI